MCVGSSAWGGSGKVPGQRRAPPLASTPSHCPPEAMIRTQISLPKKSLDFVWFITYGHHCTSFHRRNTCFSWRVPPCFNFSWWIPLAELKELDLTKCSNAWRHFLSNEKGIGLRKRVLATNSRVCFSIKRLSELSESLRRPLGLSRLRSSLIRSAESGLRNSCSRRIKVNVATKLLQCAQHRVSFTSNSLYNNDLDLLLNCLF